jgi:predicted aspartyl protease
MPPKNIAIIVAAGLFILVGGALLLKGKSPTASVSVQPTPTPEQLVAQLPAESQPSVNLKFSSDGHYVTVNVTNIHAELLEYNLIYDAKVKGNRIQTGVNASSKLAGKSTYTQQQLLGSESSGKFTYHSDIQNAIMELTLRDSTNRSVFSATYPFTITPGKSTDLNQI